MKRLLVLAIAVIAILSMTIPAMASTPDVTTSVTVISGGGALGDPSNVVASWVLCDDDPITPMTQICPPLEWQTYKPVCYFALVDDQQGDDDVVNVDVDVWHPADSPCPYDANNYLKYERPMCRFANFLGAQNPWAGPFEEIFADAWFDQAEDANIVAYGTNPDTGLAYTDEEIEELIDQESVGFWAVCVDIYYEQPAGTYPVRITAVDKQSNIGTLDYSFYYIPVSMVDFDFNAINFGKVMVNTNQEIDGDRVFAGTDGIAGFDVTNTFKLPSPAQATVRNIGNVWSKITVSESNLFDSNNLPLPCDPGWNVRYDACLSDPGVDNPKTYFWPYETVELCRNLFLSETQKLDFSLKFMKYGQTGVWTGTMCLGSCLSDDWPTALLIEVDTP